jgi:hypothetical protein
LRSHSWTDRTGDVDALEAIQTTQHSVWQWLDCRHVLCVGFHLVNMCSVLDIGVGEQDCEVPFHALLPVGRRPSHCCLLPTATAPQLQGKDLRAPSNPCALDAHARYTCNDHVHCAIVVGAHCLIQSPQLLL